MGIETIKTIANIAGGAGLCLLPFTVIWALVNQRTEKVGVRRTARIANLVNFIFVVIFESINYLL